MRACVRACVCVCDFSQMKPKFMWHQHGIGEKMESLLELIRLFVVIHYCQPRGRCILSRDFTTNLAPQFKAFSMAFEN